MDEVRSPTDPKSAPLDLATLRSEFRMAAQALIASLGSGFERFQPGGQLSEKAEWLIDSTDEVLVVVVGRHEDHDVADELLAYSLAWQADRDLVLVLPESHVGQTLGRLAWVGTPVRVFTYDALHELRPAVVPTRAEVLDAAKSRPLRALAKHDLGHRSDWVEALTRSATEHWALVPAHRRAYLAWHCAGRQVLRINRTHQGLDVIAGVAYTKPSPDEPEPLHLTLSGSLTPAQRAEIEACVATAIWQRIGGEDQGHLEHRLQAALAATELRPLGLAQFAREYPAWRGEGRPGYLDFLGVDRTNRLHVVETKVGTADPKLVLQTLDYAIWVAAHDVEIPRGARLVVPRG